MRKKIMAGAAILALLMNSPQVKAEDEIFIFGGEFEDSENKTAQKEVDKPKPKKELPPPEENSESEVVEIVEVQSLENEDPAPIELQEDPVVLLEEDDSDNLPKQQSDDLSSQTFDEPFYQPEKKPLKQQTTEPPAVEEPIYQQEVEDPSLQSAEYERPFELPIEISNEWQERVEDSVAVVPPPAQSQQRAAVKVTPQNAQQQTELKMLKPRFIKLAVDDTYIYYLDKNAVEWKKMPYSSSEYMADVWIRMIEREPKQLDNDMAAYGEDNFMAQIALVREQGYQYPPEDITVLRQQNYILEHYYLRPKTRQVQFLCELEVFGRPQNTINERAYDYRNWENLVPGSVESTIYDAAIKILGKSKASERGHMTLIDMIEEYGRISLR